MLGNELVGNTDLYTLRRHSNEDSSTGTPSPVCPGPSSESLNPSLEVSQDLPPTPRGIHVGQRNRVPEESPPLGFVLGILPRVQVLSPVGDVCLLHDLSVCFTTTP